MEPVEPLGSGARRESGGSTGHGESAGVEIVKPVVEMEQVLEDEDVEIVEPAEPLESLSGASLASGVSEASGGSQADGANGVSGVSGASVEADKLGWHFNHFLFSLVVCTKATYG